MVDDVPWDKYIFQLNRPAYYYHERGPWVIRAFLDALLIEDKIDGLGHTAPGFPEENDIPPGSRDDVFIVRLAVESRATLITTDRPLQDDLANCSVQSRYGLRVISPEEALGAL